MMVDGRDVFHFKNFEEERAFAHKCIDAGVVVVSSGYAPARLCLPQVMEDRRRQ